MVQKKADHLRKVNVVAAKKGLYANMNRRKKARHQP